MIVVTPKPLPWLLARLANTQHIVVLGCNSCAAVCFGGGDREVEELCCALQLALQEDAPEVTVQGLACQRVCDPEFLESIEAPLHEADVVVCLACGAGSNLLSDTYEDIPLLPGVDTAFLGSGTGPERWEEQCAACGACMLDETFGLCPIARCAKTLLNGPCGGSEDGQCEVNNEVTCIWSRIIDRARRLGRLDDLTRIIPPKDWSAARHGGQRSLARGDLGLQRLCQDNAHDD